MLARARGLWEAESLFLENQCTMLVDQFENQNRGSSLKEDLLINKDMCWRGMGLWERGKEGLADAIF